jgi:hypothetical protein
MNNSFLKIMNNKVFFISIIGFACFLVSISFGWQGNVGYSLSDEGYLWYGVQRVLVGEVPLRDFMAYDPGRYYLCAVLLKFVGDSNIMSLRIVIAVLQAIGLSAALVLVGMNLKGRKFWYILISGISLFVWMMPRHKLIDIILSITLVVGLTYLAQKPSARRYFFTGVMVGAVAAFGRNHGVYGAVASIGLIAWLAIDRGAGASFFQSISIWILGVIVGFSPILAMLVFVPGFAIAFWDSIRFLFELKATNLPLPVPWPWQANFSQRSFVDGVRVVLVGLFFIGLVAFGVLAIIWIILRKLRRKEVSPAFAAAAFLTLPYAHYAYSRADVPHLAQNISPFLIGCFVLLGTQSAKLKWSLAPFLCIASIWTAFAYHPGWQAEQSSQWVSLDLTGDRLLVDPDTANNVTLLRRLERDYAKDGRGIIVVPLWPGAYATLHRKAPIWEICPIFPRSENFEAAEIARMSNENIGVVLMLDVPLDGREELRFRNTHPLTYRYIDTHFKRIDAVPSAVYRIYVADDQKKMSMFPVPIRDTLKTHR